RCVTIRHYQAQTAQHHNLGFPDLSQLLFSAVLPKTILLSHSNSSAQLRSVLTSCSSSSVATAIPISTSLAQTWPNHPPFQPTHLRAISHATASPSLAASSTSNVVHTSHPSSCSSARPRNRRLSGSEA